MTENRKFKIAMIGTGGIARHHISAYLKQPDVEIVAAADLVPGKAEAFMQKYGVEGVRFYPSHKELIDNLVDQQHNHQKHGTDGAGITQLVTFSTIVGDVVNNRMGRVVGRRHTTQRCHNTAASEGAGDLHNSTEQQLGLHLRQSQEPNFLESVLNAIDCAGFVQGGINGLEACHEGQEAGTQAEPQLNDDDTNHHRISVLQP